MTDLEQALDRLGVTVAQAERERILQGAAQDRALAQALRDWLARQK